MHHSDNNTTAIFIVPVDNAIPGQQIISIIWLRRPWFWELYLTMYVTINQGSGFRFSGAKYLYCVLFTNIILDSIFIMLADINTRISMSAAIPLFRIINWTCYHRNLFRENFIIKQDISPGSFRLFQWLSVCDVCCPWYISPRSGNLIVGYRRSLSSK